MSSGSTGPRTTSGLKTTKRLEIQCDKQAGDQRLHYHVATMEDEAVIDCWPCKASKVAGATIGLQSTNETTPSHE